jgi:Ni,Fe-hydrogenase I small subunit
MINSNGGSNKRGCQTSLTDATMSTSTMTVTRIRSTQMHRMTRIVYLRLGSCTPCTTSSTLLSEQKRQIDLLGIKWGASLENYHHLRSTLPRRAQYSVD